NSSFAECELDAGWNRTGNHWHIHVSGLPDNFRFGWRAAGPNGPQHRYNPEDVLIDPAATTIVGSSKWGQGTARDRKHSTRRSLFHIGPHFDWRDDRPPLMPSEDSIIYELNVRGFTCHATSGVEQPGTFAGLTEKIQYLRNLGITAVELLPIHEFEES